jgi:hypothetical protein
MTGARYTTTSIASGAAVSGAVDLTGRQLTGFITPATLTNTAFDIQGSPDGGTNWYDISTLAAISAPVSAIVSLDPTDTVNAHYIRLQGGSNEGGTRSITIISRDLVG